MKEKEVNYWVVISEDKYPGWVITAYPKSKPP